MYLRFWASRFSTHRTIIIKEEQTFFCLLDFSTHSQCRNYYLSVLSRILTSSCFCSSHKRYQEIVVFFLTFVPCTDFSERTRNMAVMAVLVFFWSPVMTTFLGFLIFTISMPIPVAIGAHLVKVNGVCVTTFSLCVMYPSGPQFSSWTYSIGLSTLCVCVCLAVCLSSVCLSVCLSVYLSFSQRCLLARNIKSHTEINLMSTLPGQGSPQRSHPGVPMGVTSRGPQSKHN